MLNVESPRAYLDIFYPRFWNCHVDKWTGSIRFYFFFKEKWNGDKVIAGFAAIRFQVAGKEMKRMLDGKKVVADYLSYGLRRSSGCIFRTSK